VKWSFQGDRGKMQLQFVKAGVCSFLLAIIGHSNKVGMLNNFGRASRATEMKTQLMAKKIKHKNNFRERRFYKGSCGHVSSDGKSSFQWRNILQEKLLFQYWQQLPTLSSNKKIRKTSLSI